MKTICTDGDVILCDEQFDLKIASDRFVYLRMPHEKEFASLGCKAPLGMDKMQKEHYLLSFKQKLEERIGEKKMGDDK